MGNPSHPIGLRLTHYRKWTTSWLTPNVAAKPSFNSTPATEVKNAYEINNRIASTVASRGGNIQGGREDRLTSLIRRVIRPLSTLSPKLGGKIDSINAKHTTKSRGQRGKGREKDTPTATSTANRVGVIRPIDVRIRVGAGGHISLFVYYVRQFEGL